MQTWKRVSLFERVMMLGIHSMLPREYWAHAWRAFNVSASQDQKAAAGCVPQGLLHRLNDSILDEHQAYGINLVHFGPSDSNLDGPWDLDCSSISSSNVNSDFQAELNLLEPILGPDFFDSGNLEEELLDFGNPGDHSVNSLVHVDIAFMGLNVSKKSQIKSLPPLLPSQMSKKLKLRKGSKVSKSGSKSISCSSSSDIAKDSKKPKYIDPRVSWEFSKLLGCTASVSDAEMIARNRYLDSIP